MDRFCNTFAGECNGGKAFNDTPANYPNPYCVSPTKTEWNTTCTASNVSDIATGTYRDMPWVAPVDLKAINMPLPTEI